MLVFCFKVALDFDKRTYRNIEILENQKLNELHEIIFSAFDRYDEHLYSFYFPEKPTKSKQIIRKSPEYTDPYVLEDENPYFYSKTKYNASKSKIGALGLNEKYKFYYLFDFGDSWWHEITLLSIKETKQRKGFPRIIKKSGESPKQYPDFEDASYLE